MKTAIILILLLLFPALAHPLDVELLWTATDHARLNHYSIYQTEGSGSHAGPCLLLGEVSKHTLSYSITVDDGKDFRWHVAACDAVGDELKRTIPVSYSHRFTGIGRFQLIVRITPN